MHWSLDNVTNHSTFKEIKMDSNFAMLLASLVFAVSWVVYIAFYNSRLTGYVITKLVNRLYISKGCFFNIGSFSFNALSGKIMFRDVVYITHDYTVRVQDGYLIFRWWRNYVPKDVSEDLSHSDTRLSVMLIGFELHVYNRTELYSKLEELFGLKETLNDFKISDNLNISEGGETASVRKQRPEAAMARTWRDLIPVIKCDVSSSRLVFGNRLIPTTLSISFEESHFVYSTKPAVCTLDRFMHFVKCKAENVKVMLAPSLKYMGLTDQPPRYMGEGFVLMQSNNVELYFYMDEPGLVPEEPVLVTLPNGDVVASSAPKWGVDVKCGKSTNFSYGPWADRQREHLFKFFYPQDYLPMEVTKTPRPGDKRQMESFDVRMLIQNDATIDILFTKDKETNAVHINIGAGSYLEATIPWITKSNGYTTKVNGQLLHVEATTSLQFRDFVEAETLEFALDCHYPLCWNDHQLWKINLTGGKATIHVIFNHKWFFQDLINDWASKQPPDIIHFVPYTWRVNVSLKHCELITLVNHYNWIDCSSVGQQNRLENTQFGLCAHFLHLSFDLPFDEFLPETIPLSFQIQGESVDLSLFIPDFHSSRNVVQALHKNAKFLSKDGTATKKTELIPKWRNVCKESDGWVDFWWVPIGAINIIYTYNPCPPLGPTPQADISTPVKEEILLSPMRFPHNRSKNKKRMLEGFEKFDPRTLKADTVNVELEIGPSVLLLYGTALRNFLNVKENIFGEDQSFTDMQQTTANQDNGNSSDIKADDSSSNIPLELRNDFDPREYRPLEVDVSIVMHDVQAHLLKNCSAKEPPCPVILVERFGFEMKKRFEQTELQLLVSPSVLLVSDTVKRSEPHLSQGKITLSSLQVRGHAMFSNVDRELDQDTLEYAWLIEAHLGRLAGKLTAPQMHSLAAALETLVLLVMDEENELIAPSEDDIERAPAPRKKSVVATQQLQQAFQQFYTNVMVKNDAMRGDKSKQAAKKNATEEGGTQANVEQKRPRGNERKREQEEECHRLKYKFTRVAVDAIDMWLVESGAALQLWASPLRLATCNLHGKQVNNGLSCLIHGLSLRQLIWQQLKYGNKAQDVEPWLEVGAINFGPIIIESALSDAAPSDTLHNNEINPQRKFLRLHDERTKRLWFLWPEEGDHSGIRCGCTGGCAFFGLNINGPRFFKPSRRDLTDGVNVAAFRVNEPDQYPGYGQSILHNGYLIFRTTPYLVDEIELQDVELAEEYQRPTKRATSPQASTMGRRLSSTSIRSAASKEVPYARLIETTAKLDSDSKLHTAERGKLSAEAAIVAAERAPKNSVSDSKLAVDYFRNDNRRAPSRALSTDEENLQKAVQRTTSMSSENQSDAFFSADEDLNSRSSSLRNSMLGATRSSIVVIDRAAQPKKKYNSELSIIADRRTQQSASPYNRNDIQAPGSAPETIRSRLATHRSDHEIHTPEHRSFVLHQQKALVIDGLGTLQGRVGSKTSKEEENDSSTESLSSNASYQSAMGSQEDFTLIDLHRQVNRPILDSPMLMTSYVTHLSQLRCTNWCDDTATDQFSVPLFQKCGSKLVYSGGRFVPRVETLTEGVTSLKMISRAESTGGTRTPTSPFIYCWEPEELAAEMADMQEEEMMGGHTNAGSRVTVIVKLKGDLDIMISPLVLEALQRFVDSLGTTVANLHPLTVINHLHSACVSQVVKANALQTTANVRAINHAPPKDLGSYEETIRTRLQAAVYLPKVNFTFLQVSIVEEIISFSALDNVKDLTCVSLLTICFDNVTAKMHVDKEALEVMEKFHRPAVVQTGSKKGANRARLLLGLHTYTNADVIQGEPVYIQRCKRLQRQLVICVNIGKMHSQLRRLRNESSILDDAVITAIPVHKSKVLFTPARMPRLYRGVEYYMRPPSTVGETANGLSADNDNDENEDKLGFIMFECGFEGITLKMIKKSQFEGDEKSNVSRKGAEDAEDTGEQGDRSAGGNVSSCLIELRTVWFNFAAPPRAPITRKIDYTRLDWNLLSTMSPAINAWMNPSNRLAIRIVHLVRTMYRRSTATVACLMADSLDIQRVHMLTKSRHGKLTPLAQTLHNDPSLQLCSILQKYYLEIGADTVENNLRETEMPQLFTLRQGVVVLSRQWKNILYTPLLGQHTNKSRAKPLNIPVSITETTEVKPEFSLDIFAQENKGNNASKDAPDTPRSSGYFDGAAPQVAVVPGSVHDILISPSPPVAHRKRKKSLTHTAPPNSSRASIVLPLLQNGAYPFSTKRHPQIGDDQLYYQRSDHVGSNLSDANSGSSPEVPSSPLHRTLESARLSEDMYSWMAKQDKTPLEGCLESKINTLQTESSGEAGYTLPSSRENQVAPEILLAPIQDSGRLLDANQIFQPLLSALGVMPQQLRFTTVSDSAPGNEVTTLDALGSNFCLIGNMDTLKIDIVVSEVEQNAKCEKKRGSRNGKKKKLYIDITTDESPSFVCEKVSVEIEIERVADVDVNEMMKAEHAVFYISRSQLKNHTSTVINFTVGVDYISQRVNMPLLRLLHQITNMYQNVKDARNEMHEQQPPTVELRRSKTAAAGSSRRLIDSSTAALHEMLRRPTDKSALGLKISDAVISPSPSVRSRPQSFAQKLMSTGGGVVKRGGYVNLSEGVGTPATVSSLSGSALDQATTVSSEKSQTGTCWKTVYHLIDLYSNMPEPRTIDHHRFSMGNCDASEHYKGKRKYDLLMEMKSSEDIDKPDLTPPINNNFNRDATTSGDNEHARVVVFGVARIQRTKLLATLSGLKLEAEMTSLHSSLTCRRRGGGQAQALDYSITGQIGRTSIVLLEGAAAPTLQTVVCVAIGKSQALYSSSVNRAGGGDKNAGLLTVGAVEVDIPQHPIALHGMVTRGSKQLSSTIQELRAASRASRAQQAAEGAADETASSASMNQERGRAAAAASSAQKRYAAADTGLLRPLVMQFSVIVRSLTITAALLPSLKAQYKMDQINSTGFTGHKAKFAIDLPHHSLSFTARLHAEANLPAEASIALPAVHATAEYIPENQASNGAKRAAAADEGAVFRPGGYLNANAEIGVFRQSLTTDLLNHLVFVQKVFMKEVNEVVRKVYGGERPVPLWLEDAEEQSATRVLFALVVKMQGIEITATTAGSSAVRLETGEVMFDLSNRIQNISGAQKGQNAAAKLFGKAQVDFKLSLGQLIRNAIFEEAEIEFQPVAFFNTRIGLRNAFQDEIVEGEDKEVVLLTLKRPLLYIQPSAIDKAILVWLNYKNAYDYWDEKRANLNKEILRATSAPGVQDAQRANAPPSQPTSTLFLQLTVEDMGICLPLNPLPVAWNQRNFYEDSRGAVVVTLENTSISACSSGSLVSKGKFSNLCLRFADDFENSFDDWKPDMSDASTMNLCVVSDGTYDFCSRTIAAQRRPRPANAKWFLNVQWQMEGVDINLDTNIGKQLSALGHTLTTITGAEDAPFPINRDAEGAEDAPTGGMAASSQESILKSLASVADARSRSKAIEKAMNEQAKIINDLRTLGASHGTIEDEMRKLHELEELVYKDFRRDMIQKLRRQSVRASSIKGKFGLGGRARSFVARTPLPEDSPTSQAPSRSGSLKIDKAREVRVTFDDDQVASQTPSHKSPVLSTDSDLSLPYDSESPIDWVDHLDIDGETVTLRRPHADDRNPYSTAGTFKSGAGAGGASAKPQEPNVDLELDVKVFINSGKCVLHTKEQQPMKEDDIKTNRMRKERSSSAGLLEFPAGSPDTSRRHHAKGGVPRHRQQHATIADLTVFHIPGMDVKLSYVSKVVPEESEGDASVNNEQFAEEKSPKEFERVFNSARSFSVDFDADDKAKRIDKAFKRQEATKDAPASEQHYHQSQGGDLRVSSSLHGIANPNYAPSSSSSTSGDEPPTVSSADDDDPRTLTKALEAPTTAPPRRSGGVKKAALFAWMTLQSVPEETTISPHILEFLEQTLEPIPAAAADKGSADNDQNDLSNYGNYVYASFPVDVIVFFHMQPSTFRFSCLPVSRVECLLQLPSLDIVFSSKRAEDEHTEFGDAGATAATAFGGLSVTGCLSDFSVYIFHPYGGGKKSTLKESQWSPLSDSERKDSLSINVEFVKIHLSRSRMLNIPQQEVRGKATGADHSRAVIRFTTICDIGSASFKYDMRRLTEILAFPKAWYRRSIVRRMFLGDLSMTASRPAPESDASPRPNRPNNGGKDKSPMAGKSRTQRTQQSTPEPIRDPHVGVTSKGGTTWETLVLFAVNFKKLNVHMNMGNVMGNVSWLTREFRSDGRLSIGSTGRKNLYIALRLGGTGLEARGGIVGGNIEVANIDTFVHLQEEPDREPHHTVGVRLRALELRLDYMATSVFMWRVSDLTVNLRDEWKLNQVRDAFIPTRRPAMIFVHGDLSWDQLQMMISKSTTADLLKMFNKLEEFFSQQFNSSKRAFSGLASSSGRPSKVTPPKVSQQEQRSSPLSGQATQAEARHHRHWQRVLSNIAGLRLNTMSAPLPLKGTVLGGTMELHGNNISLACFHGINFKSKSWALFSLKEPCISFNTEAQEIPSENVSSALDVHVVQTLTCSLGLSTYKTHLSMATICKVSRTVIFPPQFKTLQEWFHYTFGSSQIDEVDRFPSLEKEKNELTNSIERGRGSGSSTQKLVDPNHNREVIFAIPSLQLHLKTEHLQSAGIPNIQDDDSKPVVECSFITEFEDHIFVTVDAEAFFFLHDVITSYVKEKERVMGSLEKRITFESQDKAKSSNENSKKSNTSSDSLKLSQDWREFSCKTWHLEPTVRLLSVAGKYIEPYGIDYILHKLGFSHARITIPKWMQRGFMDPLDATLAVLTLRMVQVVRGEEKNREKDKAAIETSKK